MRYSGRSHKGIRTLLSLALAAALSLAVPSLLSRSWISAQSLGSAAAVCPDGSLTAPGEGCPPVGLSTCPGGVQPPAADQPCPSAPPGVANSGAAVVTSSSIGTDACPGGVAVVAPDVPCPVSASQMCPTGLLLPVTQTCPGTVFTFNCPNGQPIRSATPCPGVDPSSCPNGGVGPKPEYCAGI